VGHRRAQIVALHGCAWSLLVMANPAAAHPYAVESVEVARSVGARRFIPEGMAFVAACLGQQGNTQEALAMLREADGMSREMVKYFGPPILGLIAQWTGDAEERNRCLDDAMRVFEGG